MVGGSGISPSRLRDEMNLKFWRRSRPSNQPAAPSSKDWESVEEFKNLPVLELIHLSEQDDGCFIVFLNYEEDVDYKTTKACDQKISDDKCGKVLSRISVLEAVPIWHLPKRTRIAFRSMLGESLARALHGDHPNAKALLDAANLFVAARNQELARRWFVTSASIAAIFLFAISIPIWLHRASLAASWGVHFIPIVIACVAGAAGALFSVLTRAAKIPLDPSAGPLLHFIEGAGHIAAGMIGSIFVYLALKTGLFAPKLLEFGLVGQALACMVAGTSERLVPTIIRKVDMTRADTAKGEK